MILDRVEPSDPSDDTATKLTKKSSKSTMGKFDLEALQLGPKTPKGYMSSSSARVAAKLLKKSETELNHIMDDDEDDEVGPRPSTPFSVEVLKTRLSEHYQKGLNNLILNLF
jgi:hypothetical protein